MTSKETKDILEKPEVYQQVTTERYTKPIVTDVPETRVVQQPDIVYLNEELKLTMDSGNFDLLPTQPMRDDKVIRMIAGKSLNHMWGLSRGGDLFELIPGQFHREWRLVPSTMGLKFKNISASKKKNILFAVGTNGTLHRYNLRSRQMDLVDIGHEKLDYACPAGKRKIYGIRDDGVVLFIKPSRLGHTKIEKIGDGMKFISVGGVSTSRNNEVWALGKDNKLYRYYRGLWVMFPFQMIDVSITKDNAVYAVGVDGALYKWNGHKSFVRQYKSFKTGLAEEKEEKIRRPITNVMAYKERTKVFSIDQETGALMRMRML